MATLTMADYEELRNRVYRFGQGKEEMKALPTLMSIPQLLAAFQAIETFWEANRATLKTQIDTAYGQTITAALAKKLIVSWLQWKIKAGG